MITEGIAVKVERTFDAPPERIYRAWLDPDLLARWIAPRERSVTRAEVDERVGGRFSIFQAEPDGTDIGGMEAEITELVPDERLAFEWHFVGPEREPAAEATRLTVALRPLDGGRRTELTLVHERLDSLREVLPHVADAVEDGWNNVFDKLAGAV